LFKVHIDTSTIGEVARGLRHFDIDALKYLNSYMAQVYAELSKQHGRPFQYVTPPGDKRRNVYKRSGQLLQELKASRYARKTGPNTWEGGFEIPPSSYLAIHAGNKDDGPTIIKATGSSSLFWGRMAIPLRAALNSDGTPKILNPRMMGQMLILPAKVLLAGKFEGKRTKKGVKPKNNPVLLRMFSSGGLKVDFSGEDTKKFHDYSLIVCKVSGRKLIPMFVLAKEVRIPKRIFIGETMEKYEQDLYNQLADAVDSALSTEGF
jgi:hypothetical protein